MIDVKKKKKNQSSSCGRKYTVEGFKSEIEIS